MPEKDKKLGGILRYGIPDFKLKKWVIDRRLEILEQEGIILKPNVDVGKDISKDALLKEFDAVVLTGGSRTSRDLKIEGRDLKGIYFAMDYLTQSNRMVSSEGVKGKDLIGAWGKKVLVIGGGDTGSDCVGTAHRQEASCVVQIELLPQPEKSRTEDFPWPYYPMILKTSTSHEEGGKREWAVLTKKFIGNKKGNVTKLECVRVEFDNSTSPPKMKEAIDKLTNLLSCKLSGTSSEAIICAILSIMLVLPTPGNPTNKTLFLPPSRILKLSCNSFSRPILRGKAPVFASWVKS